MNRLEPVTGVQAGENMGIFTEILNKTGIMGEEENKVCLICGEDYIPADYQAFQQKYCSKKCKRHMKRVRRKESGMYTGGYSRKIPIILWLKAMGIESYSAPCHYCGKELEPDKFNIDHKVPRTVVRDYKKLMMDMDNMVISCITCNGLKGATEYAIFKEMMETNK